MKQFTIIILGALFFVFACNEKKQQEDNEQQTTDEVSTEYKGKLFIIGGGKRPPELVKRLIVESGVDKGGYIVILPMSSSAPDTSAFYARKQFVEQGIEDIVSFNFIKDEEPSQLWLDSLKNAQMIYITGGNQNRFMEIVQNTPIHDAIKEAFKNGATIAGTSAGAAVMSKKMITGNEYKHAEYTGEFRTIEAENMEIKEGLGLIENAIIDQHFVQRMRMNRLISTTIENPEETGIGIDESTAIVVQGNTAWVAGKSQVIVIRHPKNVKAKNGLLGATDMELEVLLPCDTFKIKE